MSPLLTDADVAALLVVSRKTVQRMAEAGRLPGLKVGRQWRFRPERIAEWMAARETAATQPETTADASAPAAVVSRRQTVATIGPLPSGYTPVFGHLRGVDAVVSNAASPAAGRGRAARAKRKAV